MEALIEKAISGNNESYAELIDTVKLDLYRVAKLHLTNEDDIEDAIQETIIKSYLNLHKLKNKKFFKTWITRILINECNNINSEKHKEAELLNIAFYQTDSIDYSANFEDDVFVNTILDKLDDDEREMAKLYFVDNFTTEQIARILHAKRNTVKSRLYRMHDKIRRLLIAIIAISLITATTVFAKDIIKFIVSLFTTSRSAMDIAVENDYVQNVQMDFVYDQDVGIKVDYMLIDNKDFNISYVFDLRSNEYKDVTNVTLADYEITDENGNVIFDNNSLNDLTLTWDGFENSNILEYNIIKTSCIYSATNYYPIPYKLVFNINKIEITKNNKKNFVDGTWNFEINIDDKFINNNTDYYLTSYNEYIKEISTKLDETCLTIDLTLNFDIDSKHIIKMIFDKNCFLENNFNEKFLLIDYESSKNNKIYLKYDISKYSENIDNLHLYLKLSETEKIDIYFKK